MIFKTKEGIEIHYTEDYFGPPWLHDKAEVCVLVHGIAEHSGVWFDWIAPLATTYRVIRVDVPGFGKSRVPSDKPYSWDPQRLAGDIHQLVKDGLHLKRFHLIGAKYGGSVVAQFAADHSDMLASLSVIGGPVRVYGKKSDVDVAAFSEVIASKGMLQWADQSMDHRLGKNAPPELRRWWVDMMANSDPRATAQCTDVVAGLDMMSDIGRITVPSLFITTEGSPLLPIEPYRADIATIGNSRLVALKGNAYHPATMNAKESIAEVRRHLQEHRYA